MARCGESMGGSFVYSLVAREQSLVVAGLDVIANQLPFPVLGIDSDNDSVIISDTLTEYCAERGIEFTSKGLMDIIGININGFCANQIMSIRRAFYDRSINEMLFCGSKGPHASNRGVNRGTRTAPTLSRAKRNGACPTE